MIDVVQQLRDRLREEAPKILRRLVEIVERSRVLAVELWWGDERFPPWYLELVLTLRSYWYRGKRVPCDCPGCPETCPKWWSTYLCWECAHEECVHPTGQVVGSAITNWDGMPPVVRPGAGSGGSP